MRLPTTLPSAPVPAARTAVDIATSGILPRLLDSPHATAEEFEVRFVRRRLIAQLLIVIPLFAWTWHGGF